MQIFSNIFNNKTSKIDTETLLEKLSGIVGLEVLEKVVGKNFDRRLLMELISKNSGMPEDVILKKLAKKLHWNYLEKLTPLDFREIYEPLMISELRQYGLMPLVSEHSVVGYACCEPSLVPDKYWGLVQNSKVIASWETILQTLVESEQLSLSKKADTSEQAKDVISLLYSEVNKFSGTDLVIIFEDKKTSYEFKSSTGKIGTGVVDASVSDILQDFLITVTHSQSKEFTLAENQKFAVQRVGNRFTLIDKIQTLENAVSYSVYTVDYSSKKALILENDIFFANVLERFLVKLGIETKIVLDGDGYEQIKAEKPDIVFCSTEFGDRACLQIVKHLRKSTDCRDVPFVILTPKKAIDFQVSAITAGASLCISKREQTKKLYTYIESIFLSRAEPDVLEEDAVA